VSSRGRPPLLLPMRGRTPMTVDYSTFYQSQISVVAPETWYQSLSCFPTFSSSCSPPPRPRLPLPASRAPPSSTSPLKPLCFSQKESKSIYSYFLERPNCVVSPPLNPHPAPRGCGCGLGEHLEALHSGTLLCLNSGQPELEEEQLSRRVVFLSSR